MQLYSSLHDDHDLKKARQALINRIGKKDQLLTSDLFSSIQIHLGVTDYSDGILELYDDIVSRQVCLIMGSLFLFLFHLI